MKILWVQSSQIRVHRQINNQSLLPFVFSLNVTKHINLRLIKSVTEQLYSKILPTECLLIM